MVDSFVFLKVRTSWIDVYELSVLVQVKCEEYFSLLSV